MAALLIQLLCLFALALWVGGGAAIAFLAAPAVFAKAGSRRLAGELVGAILRRFDLAVLGLGAVAGLCALAELFGAGGGVDRWAGVKLGTVAGMIALAGYSRLVLTPRIARLRDELGDALDRIPREDPRRRAFGRLHGFSVLCLLGQLLLGTVALVASALLLTHRPS